MDKKLWAVGLGLCGALSVACADASPELAQEGEQATELHKSDAFRALEATVRALNAIGAKRTGITYSLQPPPVADAPPPIDGQPPSTGDVSPPADEQPPPTNDRSPTLVLDSEPFAGLIRAYQFPAIAGAFDIGIVNLPPGPTLPSSFLARVFAMGEPTTPLAALATPPPVGDRPASIASTLQQDGLLTRADLELPDPKTKTPGSLLVRTGAPGQTPLVTVALPPGPVRDRAAFQVNGANFRVVGTATLGDSMVAFDVFDADGRLVGSFGK